MKRILLIGTLCLSGCGLDYLSVHPLFEENDLVFEESLLGRWRVNEDNDVWSFTRAGDGSKSYRLEVSNPREDEKSVFSVHLVRIAGLLFLDATDAKSEGYMGIPGHLFGQVRLHAGGFEISFIDEKWLKEKVSGEKRLSHLRVRKTTVVTASPRELQDFLMLFGWDPEAFQEWGRFTRVEEPRM